MAESRVESPTAGRLRSWPSVLSGPNILLAGVFVVLVVFAILTPGFTDPTNLSGVVRAAALTGIAAVGMSFVTISGKFFSMSIAAEAMLGAVVFGKVGSGGPVVAILAVVVAGLVLGLVQGALVAAGTNPVVTTLAVGGATMGILTLTTNGSTLRLSDQSLAGIGTSMPLGVPVQSVVFVALTVLAAVVVHLTTAGQKVILVGANIDAAVSTGIRVGWVVTACFMVSGVAAALVGMFSMAQFGQINGPGQFDPVTIDVIAAVLVSGIALRGGLGSPVQAALGAVFLAAILNIFTLRGYPTGTKLLIEGCVVLVAVLVNNLSQQRRS